MKSYIWDTGALSLYFTDHKESKKFMYQCENDNCYVPYLILTEFLYLQWRQFGSRIAKLRLESIIHSHLNALPLTDKSIVIAGEFKVKYPKLSLADAVLVTLSKENNSTILTTELFITEIKKIKAVKLDF